jgi:hypothetical protein
MTPLELMSAAAGQIDMVLVKYGRWIAGTEEKPGRPFTFVIDGPKRRRGATHSGKRGAR